MEEDIKELTIHAKEVIEKIPYITIATSTKDAEPWNSPVYSAFDQDFNFYWASWIQNQHSKNIKENGRVFIVIYDSTVPPGTGFGVYFKGIAKELSENHIEEIKKAKGLLAKRVNKTPRKVEEYLGEYPRRIFKFTPEKIWVNGDGDVNRNYVDVRIDITNEFLRK